MQTRHVPSTPTRQGAITVRLWSTKVWHIADLSDSVVPRRERLHTTYVPADRVICWSADGGRMGT